MRQMEILETETFRRAKERLLSKREYQFIQRQILHPTRVIPKLKRSGGIRKLVWVGTLKGRRRKMQILYYYRKVDRRQGRATTTSRQRAAHNEPNQVKELASPLGFLSGYSDTESYQVTMLYVSKLRDSRELDGDQIRRMRTAIQKETKG